MVCAYVFVRSKASTCFFCHCARLIDLIGIGLWHRFKPNEETKDLLRERNRAKGNSEFEELFERADLCAVCGLQYWRHYVDPNGNKIEVVDDHSDTALHGDLMGRVSMSVATRDTRDDLMRQIERINQVMCIVL